MDEGVLAITYGLYDSVVFKIKVSLETQQYIPSAFLKPVQIR